MWRSTLFQVATVVFFLNSAVVNAQEPGDRQAGFVFAQNNCASCHGIGDADKKSPNLSAPTFASVAATSGMSGRALAVWLQTSHPTMPNFLVDREDRDNVIAYIMSMQPAPVK